MLVSAGRRWEIASCHQSQRAQRNAPGTVLPKLFLFAAREVPERSPAVHDPVMLTEPNARKRGGRKSSGLLDVSVISVNLDQVKAHADLDGNRELVWSAGGLPGRNPKRVIEDAWTPPRFWVSLTL
jgi:hypothetical protein